MWQVKEKTNIKLHLKTFEESNQQQKEKEAQTSIDPAQPAKTLQDKSEKTLTYELKEFNNLIQVTSPDSDFSGSPLQSLRQHCCPVKPFCDYLK